MAKSQVTLKKKKKTKATNTDSVWVLAGSSVQSLCLCSLVFLWDSQQLDWRVALTLWLMFGSLSPTLGWLFQPWYEDLCLVLMYLIKPCLMDIPRSPALSSFLSISFSLSLSLKKGEELIWGKMGIGGKDWG